MHDCELTYSLATPSDRLPAGGPTSLYRLAHESLIAAICQLAPSAVGRLRMHEAGIKPADGSDKRISETAFLCFLRRSEGDLLVSEGPQDLGDKVTGSAQRKRRGAVLQHGSVLLARSEKAPELPGLAELIGCEIPPLTLARAFGGEFISRLEGELVDGELDAVEEKNAATATQKFADDGWTNRR